MLKTYHTWIETGDGRIVTQLVRAEDLLDAYAAAFEPMPCRQRQGPWYTRETDFKVPCYGFLRGWGKDALAYCEEIADA